MIAQDVLWDILMPTEGATHYHAYYVNPSWAETKTYITRIDDHIFYRWDLERSK